MAAFIYQIFSSASLISLGLYHTVSTTRNFLKAPQSYSPKPFHLLPLSSSSPLRNLPLYLAIFSLLISTLHSLITSFYSDPLLKGHTPVHFFISLQFAAVSFLFLLLSLSLLFPFPLPADFTFAVSSSLFYLLSFASSNAALAQTSDLQAKLDSLSSRISSFSALVSLLLALFPRLFLADVFLGGSVCLQGLWALQTGFTLYVEAFIPEGCHRLLDVVSGVEGSTKCALDESKLRAAALLDLAFLVHVTIVVLLIFVVYAVVSKCVGVSKRFGSYEALPTSAADSTTATNHVQMKTLSGTQE